MSDIRFGTDGWRGVIAADYTFDNVRACAEGLARYLEEEGQAGGSVLIGYDTRFAAEDFAAATAEVLAAHGIHTLLCPRPTPTPVVSFGVRQAAAVAGVVITASHNPWRWQGFKVRSSYGGAASPEVVARIEALIPPPDERPSLPRLPLAEARRRGLVEEFDPRPGYSRHLEDFLDLERIRRAGLRVAVDPMYGAASGYVRELLRGGTTRVWQVRGERNPIFPRMHNPEPIDRNLSVLKRAVRRCGAQVGLATDGDADRLGIVDEHGRFLDPQRTFALLVYYMLEVRGERGPVVKSVTTTRMAFPLAEAHGLPVYETGVGFKFLGPRMLETDAVIAGEESGGYAFRGHLPERDGILSGLCMLDLMVQRGKGPAGLVEELFQRIGPHHYGRLDLELEEGQRERLRSLLEDLAPDELGGLPVVGRDAIDGHRFLLEGGWVAVRFSGTEPLMRIYAEVRGEEEQVQAVLAATRRLLGV